MHIGDLVVRGENFVELADHILEYYNEQYSSVNDIRDGDIIYCDTRHLYKFRDALIKKKDLVIITHNCVGPVSDEKPWRDDGVSTEDFSGCFRYWFAKNCYSKKDNVIPIPIGFQNIRWNKNGFRNRIYNEYEDDTEPVKLVYLNCKIGTNVKVRQQCWDECNEMGIDADDADKHRLSFEEFINKMKNYKFILSPDGYGVDCHRTWEALFVNRIPVIKNKYPLSRLYENMPVLFVNEWTELENIDLNGIYNKMRNIFNRDILTQEYWDNYIKRIINDSI